MPKTQELIYAVVGAGDFTVEKVRDLRVLTDLRQTQEVYTDFVKRGRTITKKIQNSAPTKNAVAQTKTARSQVKAARSQVKAAATSVRKAVKADAKAATAAAAKTAKA